MSEQKKNPPSEFTGDTKKEDNKYTRAIMVMTDEKFSSVRVLEDFTFDGVKYTKSPGSLDIIIDILQTKKITTSVVNAMFSMPIAVSTEMGIKNVPLMEFISSMVAGAVVQVLDNRAMNAHIINQNKGKIIKVPN